MFADFAKWPLEVLSLVSTESHCRKPSPERCHGPPGPCGQAVWRPQTPLVPSGTMLALVPFASATLGSLGPYACCSLRKGPVLASSPACSSSFRPQPDCGSLKKSSCFAPTGQVAPVSALTAAAPFVACVMVVT